MKFFFAQTREQVTTLVFYIEEQINDIYVDFQCLDGIVFLLLRLRTVAHRRSGAFVGVGLRTGIRIFWWGKVLSLCDRRLGHHHPKT